MQYIFQKNLEFCQLFLRNHNTGQKNGIFLPNPSESSQILWNPSLFKSRFGGEGYVKKSLPKKGKERDWRLRAGVDRSKRSTDRKETKRKAAHKPVPRPEAPKERSKYSGKDGRRRSRRWGADSIGPVKEKLRKKTKDFRCPAARRIMYEDIGPSEDWLQVLPSK